MIHGLDLMMSKVLGIPVTKPAVPIDAVAQGLAMINGKLPVKIKAGKNITNHISDYYKDNKIKK